MPCPIVTATAQAAVLSAASNLSAQVLGAYQAKVSHIITSKSRVPWGLNRNQQLAFSLDHIQLSRFVLLTIVTAPPNYHWQQFLEKLFPMYACSSSTKNTVSDSRDLEKGPAGQEVRKMEPGSKPRLNIRNTLYKWFFDCITLGAMVNTIAFLVLMGVMKGQSLERVGLNLRTVSLTGRRWLRQTGLRSLTRRLQETIPIIFASYRIWPFASLISFSFVPVAHRVVFLSFVGLLWGIYMSLVAAKI